MLIDIEYCNICRAGALTEKQKMAAASELSKKLSPSTVHKPLTADILSMLEKIGNLLNVQYCYYCTVDCVCVFFCSVELSCLDTAGVGNKQVVLQILPLLVDPNVSIIYSCGLTL